MFRPARGGGGKQKKCLDEREESFMRVPQFLTKNRVFIHKNLFKAQRRKGGEEKKNTLNR